MEWQPDSDKNQYSVFNMDVYNLNDPHLSRGSEPPVKV